MNFAEWFNILFFSVIGYSDDIIEWKPLKNNVLIGVKNSCCSNKEENTVILFMNNGTCIMLKGIGEGKDNKIFYKEIACPI